MCHKCSNYLFPNLYYYLFCLPVVISDPGIKLLKLVFMIIYTDFRFPVCEIVKRKCTTGCS